MILGSIAAMPCPTSLELVSATRSREPASTDELGISQDKRTRSERLWRGTLTKKSPTKGQLAFVVQKHKATSLHYDFRLEIGGVMPSWSIPKGPSLDSGVRRLALPTSDHLMDYRRFEGVIAKGGYGAGPVMVWDEGTYNPELEVSKGVRKEVTKRKDAEEAARKSLQKGNLKFRLYGKKLKGSFALVRTDGFAGKDSWLLIKHRDEYSQAGYDAKNYDFSAATNRSLAQIASQESLG
jgi:bifunctional non-homologous end joining protein LigD